MKATKETATGLRVDIRINCETEEEILSHLTVIRNNIKKYLGRPDVAGEITIVPLEFNDTNCYGDHTVIINLDK